ncbi:DNA polymerase III subunit delta' [Castellaniella sp. GW247-6E4]|uniref:DNA polymerase III subunit delta' n=1 Tax=Castellaniella sp. GW247-6E4 TaxID=3140380 RepID=UPI00331548E4
MNTPSHDGGFLPWQVTAARAWLADRERYAHAWLIHGLRGVGQIEFALAGAAALLCETPTDGLACGACQACGWVVAGNHPDLRRIRPEATALAEGWGADAEPSAEGKKKQPSREIRVEQVRGLLPWFNTATHRGGWRVAVLYPAEALNVISANTLLKILEEPPEHTIFLLAGQAPDRLLPTLVSRCRRFPLPVPDAGAARAWLESQGVEPADAWLSACGGAPLRALERARAGGPACPAWLESFLALCEGRGTAGDLADALADEEIADWVDGFQRLLVDLALRAGGGPSRYFPAQAARIEPLAARLDARRLAEAAHWLARQRRLSGHALNPRFLADHAVALLLKACAPAPIGA